MFIVDNGKAVYVWIGSGASKDEKKQAMSYAHVSTTRQSVLSMASSLLQNYLMKTKHPLVPVTCLSEGKKDATFDSLFS